MDAYEMTVRPFEMGTPKDAAIKVLEEASEAREAWQMLDVYGTVYDETNETYVSCLADELADCIQACCNLAARYELDLADAMARCEQRNRERGRYGDGSSFEEHAEAPDRRFRSLVDEREKGGDEQGDR